MTSELKCPLCQQELVREGMNHWWCLCNLNHKGKELYGTTALWQALIQAKQDLAKAIDVIDTVRQHKRGTAVICPNDIAAYCDRAIEQITHDNSEKANSVEHKESE